jgi:protein arginine N-methyltransferase 1
MSYSVNGYASMLADSVRIRAYTAALRRVVRPGSVVADIGAGPGIFSLLACSFGARKVFAIEPSPVIQMARELAAANNCDDRIEFIQKMSTRVSLPEPADVIVSDVRGILPPLEHGLSSLIDARRRFLAPRGVMVPSKDSLSVTIVNAPERHRSCLGQPDEPRTGLDFTVFERQACCTFVKAPIEKNQVLVPPLCWNVIDYHEIASPDLAGHAQWHVETPAVGHGLGMWFDTLLAGDGGFTNAPGEPGTIHGNAFFPWPEAVSLEPGDAVHVSIKASLVGADYVWCWNTTVVAADGRIRRDFRQSTFMSEPLSPDTLRKQERTYTPTLNEDGEVDRYVLERIDGGTALGQLAEDLAARFPERFRSCQDALTDVALLSVRYSR